MHMLQILTRATNHAVANEHILQKIKPLLHFASKYNLHATPVAFNKQNLPRLPVPALKETLDKYLRSVIPLLTSDELEKTKKATTEFAKPGGDGEKLQNMLHDRAKTLENWLEKWWLNAAYLGYRLPVVVHSSPGLVFPLEKFSSNDEKIAYAAKLIITCMLYKDTIDSDKIPIEKMGKDPLDMGQYKKFFGTCRIPKPGVDGLEFNSNSTHVVVACNNHFFKLPVDKSLSIQHVIDQLKYIQQESKQRAPAIGILSSDDRESWANSFKLLIKDPQNAKSVEEIQKSLFLVCLDEPMPNSSQNRVTAAGHQTVHGGGSKGNGGNRWFDKTVQFVIGNDGIVGLTYEHSPSEGQPIAVMTDFLITNMPKAGSGSSNSGSAKELKFNVDAALQEAISTAGNHLDSLIADFDLECNVFQQYGKNFIKSQKLSPDSFLQMAMQFTYYRLHKNPAAHYESAATRKYIGGRTETIRCCSIESIQFAKSMLDSSVSDMDKRKFLTAAVNGHKKYTTDAVNGFGVDRHFLGLKLIAKENNIPLPAFFNDKAFGRSIHFDITSSQVATLCAGFMCYGAVIPDGYAVCYNPRNDNMYYGVSCFNQTKSTNSKKFLDTFEQSLKDMHDVLVKTQKAKL